MTEHQSVVINFTFTLLNEGSLAQSVTGNHTLAILQISEKYDALAGAPKKPVSTLQSVTVDGKTHRVEYFLGGDMKFLALACGIDAATSNHACVWCKCHRNDRWDMSKDWSAFDASKGIMTYAAKPKSSQRSHYSPLYKSIMSL